MKSGSQVTLDKVFFTSALLIFVFWFWHYKLNDSPKEIHSATGSRYEDNSQPAAADSVAPTSSEEFQSFSSEVTETTESSEEALRQELLEAQRRQHAAEDQDFVDIPIEPDHELVSNDLDPVDYSDYINEIEEEESQE